MPTWDTDLYQEKHRFVWQHGQDLLALLAPQPGDRILDLGCGTGQLTQAIAAAGADAIGLDADAGMVAQAQQNFPALTFWQADARTFQVDAPQDAVFSNAVLHWVPEAAQVTAQVWAALKPGGRFVAELGGRGNVATILNALADSYQALDYGPLAATFWYFPSLGEYASLLEQQGFEVRLATLFDRPTPLTGARGIADWLRMFAARFWADLSPEQQENLIQAVENRTRSRLYRNGQWIADYRRLRVCAIKPL